jgi:hypothetical protein
MIYEMEKVDAEVMLKEAPVSSIHGRTLSSGGIRGSSLKAGTLVRLASQ